MAVKQNMDFQGPEMLGPLGASGGFLRAEIAAPDGCGWPCSPFVAVPLANDPACQSGSTPPPREFVQAACRCIQKAHPERRELNSSQFTFLPYFIRATYELCEEQRLVNNLHFIQSKTGSKLCRYLSINPLRGPFSTGQVNHPISSDHYCLSNT